MKLLRLDTTYDYEFELYGVVSSSQEYKLAWVLNKVLKLRLVKQEDLCYQLQGQGHYLISNYQYSSEHSVVRLFRNKSHESSVMKDPYLLPDIKEYDYVLQIAGGMQDFFPQELMYRLHQNPVVQYVKKIDPLTLYNRDNLIF